MFAKFGGRGAFATCVFLTAAACGTDKQSNGGSAAAFASSGGNGMQSARGAQGSTTASSGGSASAAPRGGGASESSGGEASEGTPARGSTGGSSGKGVGSAVGDGGDGTSGPGPGDGGAGAGAEAGQGGDSGDGEGDLILSNLVVEPNPNMTISCFVSWTTSAPATSEVRFGEESYDFRIRNSALATEHRVLVIGMHASTHYAIKAVSNTARSAASADGEFTTGVLPDWLPTPSLTVGNLAKSQVGWTLTNVSAGGAHPPLAVIFDEAGLPVWYFVQGTHADVRGDVATELVGSSVLVGPAPYEPAREVDLSGQVVWEGPPQVSPEQQTHCFRKTSNGNHLLNVDLPAKPELMTSIEDQALREFAPDHSLAWSWRLFDHVPPVGTRNELCHGNSMRFDEANGIVYYNCRYLGLFKIARATGEILWRLGGTYDSTSLGPGDWTFDPPEAHFSDAHDPEPHADGTVILYDNGLASPFVGGQRHSRVVEYKLDEESMTATRTFEFPGEFAVDSWYTDDWYTPIWGDADVLANDNVLVTAGTRSATTSTHIFEVTRAGEVVWEMVFPPENGSYRAHRLSPPPLVERVP